MDVSLVLRRGATTTACLTLALGLTACAGGDGGGSESSAAGQSPAEKGKAAAATPSGSGVEVVAKDIVFEPAEISVGPGPTKVTLRNDGAIIHSLVIEGAPRFGKLEAAKGATDTGTLDLAPGTYTAFCDQPGHRAAGMEAKLTVS